MVRPEEIRRLSVAALRILVVAGVYYAAGVLGLRLQVDFEGAVVTPLWPPTGIALCALLYLGIGIWPGIALGVLLVVVTISSIRVADLGIIGGNTLAPLCSYLMLRRVGFRTELNRLRDGVALVFLGALGGMLISSTIGTWVLVFSGRLQLGGFWSVWSAWWTGDAMGVLVVTPVLLVLPRVRLPRRDTYRWAARWAEAAALVLMAGVLTPVATRTPLSLLFLVFPLLVWAALRFQLAGSAPCTLLVSVLAIDAATDRIGPFAHHNLIEVMVTLQLLNGSAALTGLLLGAIVTEQRNIRKKIEQVCMDLADVVDHLAPGKSANQWPPDQGR
ncbi:MASE1 domain-containing protein [Streptomyces sp. NPDC051569]|uniref:MASE1 domain-containing protein n=1 Tax=Streptomyces sp. NPDC051569 TaxID=3365661 RepID=UPI00378C2C34